MAKKNRGNRIKTPQQIDQEILKLNTEKNIFLEKSLYSDDPKKVIGAQAYIQSKKTQKPDVKSWLFLPDDYSYSGKGYKDARKGVTFDQLKAISKVFAVRIIHDTRIDQVKNFLNFTTDTQKEGYTIIKKRGLFDVDAAELSKSEQKVATKIVNFLESCGNNSKWDNHDDLIEFVSKILRDSLSYDQLGFECVRSNNGMLQKIVPVDASMLRILESQDPRYVEQFKGMEWNGYLPNYCMSYRGQILENPVTGKQILYYPWELGFGIRNKVSDVKNQGYGVSELEVGIELVTWILWSFQYNSNFFKQGSQPKGFINIKDGGGDNTVVNEFRNSWRQMMTGVGNSHKIPVFEGIDLEWTDLQLSNRDMEFNQYMEFLLVIFCSLYRIDPSELGFNFSQASQIFGQDGQKERLQHSKSKGLKPLLVFLEKIINKYVVSEIDENYQFKFTGIDIEDEEAQVELDKKKSEAGFVSHEDMFEKYSGRKYDDKKDTILNQVHLQASQSKYEGGEEMNSIVEEETGESQGNPFEEFGKSSESNPIVKSALGYINDKLG